MTPIVYRDGICVIAAGGAYRDVRYGISRTGDTSEQTFVINQEEARELVAALTWMISEVDSTFGYDSFKPRMTTSAFRERRSQQP